ncbi:MAG: hypothetical protein ACT4TC_26390, partial [Myxococcaceae bacterium]
GPGDSPGPTVGSLREEALPSGFREAGYLHLTLIPALVSPAAGEGCGEGHFTRDEATRLSYFARLAGWSTNSGYTTRVDERASAAACANTTHDVLTGTLRPDAVYVIHSSMVSEANAVLGGRADCGELWGHTMCVALGAPNAVRSVLLNPSASLR